MLPQNDSFQSVATIIIRHNLYAVSYRYVYNYNILKDQWTTVRQWDDEDSEDLIFKPPLASTHAKTSYVVEIQLSRLIHTRAQKEGQYMMTSGRESLRIYNQLCM